MNDFVEQLAAIIGKPSTQRPFVCDGFPSSCPVWIVGYNAATSGGDWWRFWSSENGFDLASWRSEYDAERKGRGKGPSATRLRIDRVKVAIPDILETNIFATPSTRMENMPSSKTEAFDLLLATFKPKTIIAHGVPAANHLAGWFGGELIVCPHFSRAGYATIDEIIARVQEE
ncbi:hypothetical protein [Pseudoruegeria sp. SHC-113]|uniref:hypothetical protein n=1 Tax=Pseudoruegeria sp. SHC-113 TaxID=2855439 RepID=UPI0021BBA042|nr:hypothetical protein [Pseudoruegeria sp. SHC-113]MCT8161547.1 hypothetical protein [Pseudoruegeria sp. SHC-113]